MGFHPQKMIFVTPEEIPERAMELEEENVPTEEASCFRTCE